MWGGLHFAMSWGRLLQVNREVVGGGTAFGNVLRMVASLPPTHPHLPVSLHREVLVHTAQAQLRSCRVSLCQGAQCVPPHERCCAWQSGPTVSANCCVELGVVGPACGPWTVVVVVVTAASAADVLWSSHSRDLPQQAGRRSSS